MSNCWKELIDSLSIFTDCLSWKPRNGKEIRDGLDLLIVSYYYYKCFESLVSTLHSKLIFTLDQVVSIESGFAHGFNWKNTNSLGILGEQKLEWKNYVRGLKHSGFVLYDERDKNFWTWDNKLGKSSRKQS